MADPAPPVILLAYANPNLRGYVPLDRLVDEARDLRAILQPTARAGRCELVEIPNATLTEVLDAFQDLHTHGRIAVFHFAGHGQGDSLLLEERTGVPLLADAGGIAAFLARQAGLRLVFLNACSTADQVEGLHAAGVPAVVATDLDVTDEWAHPFAVRFYKGLVGGSSLVDAFGEAEAGVYAQYGGNRAGEVWPWRLHLRAEEDGKWVLPARRVRPARTVPLQKPLRTQHFIGREQELARLLEDLQPGKVVTLCGPGGMGKSALAAEASGPLRPATSRPTRFPDGIIFHTFYHQPQADLALEAIARVYGVDPRPSPRTPPAGARRQDCAARARRHGGSRRPGGSAVRGRRLRRAHYHAPPQQDAPDGGQDIAPLPRAESLHLLRAWAGRPQPTAPPPTRSCAGSADCRWPSSSSAATLPSVASRRRTTPLARRSRASGPSTSATGRVRASPPARSQPDSGRCSGSASLWRRRRAGVRALWRRPHRRRLAGSSRRRPPRVLPSSSTSACSCALKTFTR